MGRTEGLLRKAERGCEKPVRRVADEGGKHRIQRHDARLSSIWRGGKASGAISDLEKYHYRRGFGQAFRSVPLPHPPALEYRPFVSGDPEWGGACEGYPLPDDAGRLYPLETDRGKGDRDRRGCRHVPHWFRRKGFSRRDAGAVWWAGSW